MDYLLTGKSRAPLTGIACWRLFWKAATLGRIFLLEGWAASTMPEQQRQGRTRMRASWSVNERCEQEAGCWIKLEKDCRKSSSALVVLTCFKEMLNVDCCADDMRHRVLLYTWAVLWVSWCLPSCRKDFFKCYQRLSVSDCSSRNFVLFVNLGLQSWRF